MLLKGTLLKCVGGKADGQRVDVPNGSLSMRVFHPLDRARASVKNTMDADWIEAALENYTIYTRRVIRGVAGEKVEEIEYLAPEGMSDIESIRHMFA